MKEPGDIVELLAYLVRTTRLAPAEARRVIGEIVSFLDETPAEFLRRRHLALQAQGLPNAQIFTGLLTELEQRRFRAPQYTQRQIRRIIYG